MSEKAAVPPRVEEVRWQVVSVSSFDFFIFFFQVLMPPLALGESLDKNF